MSRIFTIVMALVLVGCATSGTHSKHELPPVMTGPITAEALLRDYPEFRNSYNTFAPKRRDLRDMQMLDGLDLTVFFGVWCHDSQREVPKLLKLLLKSGVQIRSLQLHTVDYEKSDASGLAASYKVSRTPTIILARNGKVLGRFEERAEQITMARELAYFAKKR